MADRSISVNVKADVSDLQRNMASASQTVQSFKSDVAGMARAHGQEMTSIGKAAAGAGLAIGAGLGLGVKAAIDWESAFAGVIKTVDATAAELDMLEQGLRDMSKEIPASHAELAGIAEAAGQLGIETGNILAFTETMAALGVATNLTSEEAATMFARFANITQLPQTQIQNLGSSVVDLGNNLATTEREIIEMGLRIAGAGSQVGLTESEILGFAGALSSVGIEAQAGGTAISRVFIELDKSVRSGDARLQQFAQTAGMTAAEFTQAYGQDAAGAMITFIEGLGQIRDEGGNVFGVLESLGLQDIRVRDALLRASGAGDLFRQSIERSNDAFEANTALTKEAEQRYGTVASQIQMAKNSLYDLGIVVGEVLLPVLVPMLDGIKMMVEWFSNLPAPVQTAGVVLAAVAATLLTIGGTALIVIPRIIALVDAWKKLSTAMALSKATVLTNQSFGPEAFGTPPTVSTGGGVGKSIAGGLAVTAAATLTLKAIDDGMRLADDIGQGNKDLTAQVAELMRAAQAGDKSAAERLESTREAFVENAGWFDKNVAFWSEAFVANRAFLNAQQEVGAVVSDFNEGFRGGAEYAGTWSSGMDEASSATDNYRISLEEAAEAQRVLVEGMNVAFGEVGNAVKAIQDMQKAQDLMNSLMEDGEASAGQVAEAQFAYASSLYNAQEAIDQMSPDALEATIQGLAGALGISTDEAYELLAALNLLDGKEVRTVISVKQQWSSAGAASAAAATLGRPLHMRAAGGATWPNEVFQVGEGNRPELYWEGGSLFMVPGDQGRVFSNAQTDALVGAIRSGSSGGGVTNNLTMYWPQGERVESGVMRGLARASFLRAAS